MKKVFTSLLALAGFVLLASALAPPALARSMIWFPHGGHVGGFRGMAGPRMGPGFAGPRFGPGFAGPRYGAGFVGPRYGPGFVGPRYGAGFVGPRYGGVRPGLGYYRPGYGAYGRWPYRYGRYGYPGWHPYGYGPYWRYAYWRRHNYWPGYYWPGYWVGGLALGTLAASDWYDGGYDYPPYDTGDYTPVPSGGIGQHCQTPVRICLLYNASYVGGGCSCRVPGGRARGVVIP